MRCVARCALDLPLCTVDDQLGYYCGRDPSLQVHLILPLALPLPLTLPLTLSLILPVSLPLPLPLSLPLPLTSTPNPNQGVERFRPCLDEAGHVVQV